MDEIPRRSAPTRDPAALGAGGMGEVFLAYDSGSTAGGDQAHPAGSGLRRPSLRERFRREARLAAAPQPPRHRPGLRPRDRRGRATPS